MYINEKCRFPNFSSLPTRKQRRFIHDEESLSIFAITSFIEFARKFRKLSATESLMVDKAINNNDVKTLINIFNSVEDD